MSKRINEIFTRISPHYDALNTLFSLGLDARWRSAAAAEAMSGPARRVLDVGTGTGLLALAVANEARRRGTAARIDAIDPNSSMLRIARRRTVRARAKGIHYSVGDALDLRFEPGSIDAVVSGFVLRNLDDRRKFYRETYRVLRKNGRFVFIDMALPDSVLGRALFRACTPAIRAVGAMYDRSAYGWLVESINRFDKKAMLRELRTQRFKRVRLTSLASGMTFMVAGEK